MKKRYSKYIRPLLLLFDILIINLVVYFIYDLEYLNRSFLLYINSFWVISSILSGFYKVYRHTSVYRLFTLLVTQLSIFMLGYFTYFGVFREGEVVHNQTNILVTISLGIIVFKFLSFYALKKYRSIGLNYRKTIVIGSDNTAKKLITVFKNKKELGYQFFGFFSDKKNTSEDFKGNLEYAKQFVLENQIDEIYCSLTELKSKEIKEFTKFASIHNRTIKLIPNANELYNKNLGAEFYNGSMLVLNVKKLPFEVVENKIIKRVFDIFFSIFIIIFLMSWLYPLLWLLIRIDSNGPAIFKQYREGINGKEFLCYKFRSMKINDLADKIHATKNDARVTKIGAFLRKTSLDELPQFFNVLLGDMSVVGPRPHLESLSLEYQKDVEDYLKRHAVKPGITGLAQVSGYRGEIKKKSDIKNRVRLDIFYIENWSFLLDVKIVFLTIFSVFKGDDKAY